MICKCGHSHEQHLERLGGHHAACLTDDCACTKFECSHEHPHLYHYRASDWPRGKVVQVVEWCHECGAIRYMGSWELPKVSVPA